jgi:hypothetical protein
VIQGSIDTHPLFNDTVTGARCGIDKHFEYQHGIMDLDFLTSTLITTTTVKGFKSKSNQNQIKIKSKSKIRNQKSEIKNQKPNNFQVIHCHLLTPRN